jgi:glycerol-3-phosphate O-acyltransferase
MVKLDKLWITMTLNKLDLRGNEFMKTLVILEQSQLVGKENFQKIEEATSKGDNVWILSNHQTEADPQVISILLEQHGMGHLAEQMIFIAGHKVTNDPVAIPFSMVNTTIY